MKKRITILLAVLLIGSSFLLFGAGKQQGSTAAEKEAKITFWHPLQGERVTNAWERLINDFQNDNPNIKVKAEFPAHGMEYGEKIFLNIASGTAPDILRLPSRDRLKMQFSGEKIVAFLDEISPNFKEELNIADVIPILHDYNVVNGRWIGFPIWILAHGLAYNKDIFRESGLDPAKSPGSWQDVVEYGKKITRDVDNDGKIDKWGLVPPVGENPATAIRWHTFNYSRGIEPFNEDYTKCLYNRPEAVEILQLWVDMYQKHKIMNPNIDVSNIAKSTKYFNEGRVGMILHWVVVGLSKKSFDWDVGGYPTFESQPKSTRMDGHTLTILDHSENKAAAYEFMKFFAQTDNYTKTVIDLGFLPSKISAYDHTVWKEHVAKNAYLKGFEEIARTYKLHPQPIIAVAHELRPVIARALLKAVRGIVSPKETLDEATAKVDEILADARKDGRWQETAWK